MSDEQTRILIVEDDFVLRTSLIEYLDLVGYQFTGAGSGREFYRALDSLVRRLHDKISTASGRPNPVKSSYGIGFCFAEPLVLK
jgi:DNA-binding response OmpR family regulator